MVVCAVQKLPWVVTGCPFMFLVVLYSTLRRMWYACDDMPLSVWFLFSILFVLRTGSLSVVPEA